MGWKATVEAQQLFDATIEFRDAQTEYNVLKENLDPQDSGDAAILYAAGLRYRTAEQNLDHAKQDVAWELGATVAAVGTGVTACAFLAPTPTP